MPKQQTKNQKIIFHLNLRKKWFDMILSGVKTEEYREIKKSWERIFIDGKIKIKGKLYAPADIMICFSNGYKKNIEQFYCKCLFLRKSMGVTEWGASIGVIYFVLEVEVIKPWIVTETSKPKIGQNIEYSEDGVTSLGTMDYLRNRTCMLAGTAGGFGYFGEGFATDGSTGIEGGLICDEPKYWRLND